MPELKANTRKVDYTVTVARDSRTQVSFCVKAESVSAALKAAYEKNCGWQRLQAEELGGDA